MEILRDFKRHFILVSVLYLILGIILIIWPATSLTVVCYVLGAIMILYGLLQVVRYFSLDKEFRIFKLDLFIGIVSLVFGIFTLVSPGMIISILPVIVGIFFLVEAVIKIQNAVELNRAGFDNWWLVLLVGILVAALGVLLLINPFAAMTTFVMVIGICLIVDSAASIWSVYCVSKRVRQVQEMEKIMDEAINDDFQ